MERIRKYHIQNRMKEINKNYIAEYRPSTLKKRYNPATECYQWHVLTNFSPYSRYLGSTLDEAATRLGMLNEKICNME